MKCPKCGYEFEIKVGSKIIAKGCKILTAMTTIVTAQCESCKGVMQIPIMNKSLFTIKRGKDES